ncbi:MULTISPECIES: phosphotransferase family protein [Rhodococcus]|uniref:phosphotransferase family protein n=1 Tax=Rhodococcus TaxID=1827 RepID=UPI00193AE830|nr:MULTISPECIES: phosphotransferase family protein [Rhodococcus]QRI79217.1 phosphotransferase family protein [Rhodococcus aetherivorans]QSE62515.1 phosphotransferase family protein [Rhodococcus sp. PSBB066]
MTAAEKVSDIRRQTDLLEPRVAELLGAKIARREQGPYQPLTALDVVERVTALVQASGITEFDLDGVQRMPGGASKEQFSFIMTVPGHAPEQLVLRLDPPESIVETCRYREDEAFRALAGVVPTPTTRFLDGDGTYLGQPGIITSFVDGVTKPPSDAMVVSGVGTSFTPQWRARLVPQFIDNLTKIHAVRWQEAQLPHFQAPTGHPGEAALWQVNWWSRVWHDDCVDPYPLITLAEQWMRDRLPDTDELVLLHGDFRTGNFMFDVESGQFTAVLDWELAHIGDYHEDLGWIVQRLFAGASQDGEILVCNLLTRDELIRRYEAATGRQVDQQKLTFYEMLAAYKCAVMNLGTGCSAAIRGHNHQDVLLSWMAPVAHTFLGEIARILEQEG